MDRFETCFVAIRWVVYAFIGCFLSVIFIGSVSLREEYIKTTFLVVAIHENNQTLLIAFGMTVKNNIYCCTVFLMMLREALR
uniref:Uncharacterized protein n=1 Tax=Lactuca sativa TaxID=4236 RepID=A0A9R1VGJ4_LACSA|nr:hypothetical protein LSAT_V11C500234790 [Lactuca sativa]